jgi:very-short-patch-repair endonuclease
MKLSSEYNYKDNLTWTANPDIFIADFYCHEKKLIIELDGGIHDSIEQKEHDDKRTFELEEKDLKF